MSLLPLFYSSIAVINRDTDRQLRVTDGSRSVAFARETHLVPAVVDEFASAAREFPIVFVASGKVTAPVFVVGLAESTNAFVTESGKWKARYVPAYLRRYPFILADVGAPDSVVCIDGDYQTAADGARLFADDGSNTPYFDAMIANVNGYVDASRRTDRFVAKLTDHDLLRSIEVEVVAPDGKGSHRQSFLAVNEARLADLSKKAFLSLRDAGHLPLIYAHLFSLSAFANLSDKAHDVTAAA